MKSYQMGLIACHKVSDMPLLLVFISGFIPISPVNLGLFDDQWKIV